MRVSRKFSKIFQMPIAWLAFFLFKLFLNYTVEGKENLKGFDDKPVIFASNHNSYLDGAFVAISLDGLFFPTRFIVAERFFSWKYFPINILLKLSRSIAAKRALIKKEDNSHLDYVLQDPIAALNNGEKIWIFPEGGFNNDGTPKKPRHGVVFLHNKTGAPIVPVRIIGNEKVMSKIIPFLPSVKSFLGINEVKVVIGKPIYNLIEEDLETGLKKIMSVVYRIDSSKQTKGAKESRALDRELRRQYSYR